MLDSRFSELVSSDAFAEKLSRVFRSIAGSRLAECAPTGDRRFVVLDKLLKGGNSELTESILLDSYVILTATGSEEYLPLSDSASARIAGAYVRGVRCSRVGLEELREFVYSRGSGVSEDAVSGEVVPGEAVSGGVVSGEGLNPVSDSDGSGAVGTVGSDSGADSGSAKSGSTSSDDRESVKEFYSNYIDGVKNELLKRYTGLFASGYEVMKPDGLLTEGGIVYLSGSELKVKENSVSTMQIYSMFKDLFGLVESEARSRADIANAIYGGYTSHKSPIYFPNKMVEFAYGREHSGARAESLRTYKPHASATSWGMYKDSVVSGAIKSLIEDSVVRFLELTVPSDGNPKDISVVNSVLDFLKYFQTCLSMCLLMVDYKKSGGKPVKFTLRVCDPFNRLGSRDCTGEIISRAFIGGTGEVPYSYKPRFEEESFVKEYSHEFNHDVSQAMPLFAYKALDALKAQGVGLSWKGAVLGTFEDGSILRNGSHGVDMSSKLIHWMMAGSRAGKGVMTLNLLASALASNKVVFYADRKPDMASVLKYLASGMCVINGGGYAEQYDRKYKQFSNLDDLLDKSHIPSEALQAFQTSASWDELGDIFYMRFLKLVIGIIVARAEGKFDIDDFGGKDGIFLVLDEFKNFQDSFSALCTRAAGIVPPSTLSKDREALEKGSISRDVFNASYNNAGYYALSYLNSLAEDMKFLSEKTDAGFNQEEIGLSDIIIIGQSLERGAVDRAEFQDMLRNAPGSARYRSAGSFGLKGFNLVGKSIPFNLVSFKPMDAFFGRNMDDGRSVYLAQTNRESKAYGRLDDKASNFAYMPIFTEEKRQKIVGGRVAENIQMANSCVYFKPFLILNTGDPKDDCVIGCKRRCFENGGITEKELIEEYPNDTGYGSPSDINPCVGFEDYLRRAGMANYQKILERSSIVANYVVQNCLGYQGNWFEFITDLRPEWMFTIRDVSDGAKSGFIGTRLAHMESNPVTREWYEFSGSGVSESSESGSGDFFYDDGTGDDFSSSDWGVVERDIPLPESNEVMDAMRFASGEEIDLFDDLKESTSDDGSVPDDGLSEEWDANSSGFKDVWIDDSGFSSDNTKNVDPETEKIMDLIDQLRQYGVDIQVGDSGWVARDLAGKPIDGGFGSTDREEFGEEFSRIPYSRDIESLDQMVQVVSQNVVKTFGGLERIYSLKAVGGALAVNGYFYRCKIKDLYARNIPYDVRRDINAGHVAMLFDYSLLTVMPNLRDLEFDSISFVYDRVSRELGYGSSVSVNWFFRDFRALQTLTIGKDRFTRQNYMEKIKGNDLFYHQRTAERFADAVDAKMGDWSSRSFNWTKNLWKKKDVSLGLKIGGSLLGGTAAAATKAGQVSTKLGKKASGWIGAFSRGVKDLFNT